MTPMEGPKAYHLVFVITLNFLDYFLKKFCVWNEKRLLLGSVDMLSVCRIMFYQEQV